MDQETIRLLVTGPLTASSGMGPQSQPGLFNRKNTHAVIRAEADAAEATRRHEKSLEHAQWLRDRKIGAYTALINQLRDLDQMVREHHNGLYLKGTFDIVQASRSVRTLNVRLLAPNKVLAAVEDVMLAFQQRFSTFIEDAQNGEQDSSAFDAETKNVEEKMGQPERLISADLRVFGKAA